jgi:ankyrin repeat protein
MSFQISGFVQFFQGLFETAPPQPLAVPQRGATLQEINDFVYSLRLPAYLRNQLVDAHLRGFANHFRLRDIDRTDEGACTRFTKEFLDYFSGKPSPEFLHGQDASGMTPLMRAVKGEDFELVCDLRQHRAVVDGDLLTFAIRNNASDKIIKYLFRYVDYPENNRNELGHLFDNICVVAERNRTLAVECLKHPPFRDKLPVHDAARCGHAAVIPILRGAGFEVDAFDTWRRDGRTPLMTAMRVGHSSRAVVEALLEAGASVSLENDVGDSPLVCARAFGLKAIALLLIQHGAPTTPAFEDWINQPDEQT